jgi:hypothetical protein
LWDLKSTKRTITLHSLKIMESFDNRFTSQVDFNISEWLKCKIGVLA